MTDVGRLVGVGLMIGGITLLGTVTATLASWLVQAEEETEESDGAALRAEVARLSAAVERLTVNLER